MLLVFVVFLLCDVKRAVVAAAGVDADNKLLPLVPLMLFVVVMAAATLLRIFVLLLLFFRYNTGVKFAVLLLIFVVCLIDLLLKFVVILFICLLWRIALPLN